MDEDDRKFLRDSKLLVSLGVAIVLAGSAFTLYTGFVILQAIWEAL